MEKKGSLGQVVKECFRVRPLAVYFVLTYLLSWLCWGVVFLTNRINASVAPIIAGLFTLLVGFGPFMAAILVVKVNGGSVKQWLRQIFVRKVKFHWYLVALVIPIAIINVCGELYALMGGDVVGGFDLNLLAILIPLFLIPL